MSGVVAVQVADRDVVSVQVSDRDVVTVTGVAAIGGPPGPPGPGVPTGGTTGQMLVKATDTDYDTEWAAPGGGGAPAGYRRAFLLGGM